MIDIRHSIHRLILTLNDVLARVFFIAKQDRYKKSLPRFSIVIATYNRPHILVERTLPSILSQKGADFEIVVIGDGMKLADWSVVEGFCKKYENIILHNFSQRSNYPTDAVARWMVAGARPRNFGVKISSGDWIYVLSDDDILLPGALHAFSNAISKSPDYDCWFACYRYYSGDPPVAKVRDINDDYQPLTFPSTGIPAWIMSRSLMYFKWNEYSWKNSWNKPSDYDLLHRLHMAGAKFGYLDTLVAESPLVEGVGLSGSKAAEFLETQAGD